MAVLHNWLYVCGGQFPGANTAERSCYKFDLNGYGANWVPATYLPEGNIYFSMVTYQNSIYSVGKSNISSA